MRGRLVVAWAAALLVVSQAVLAACSGAPPPATPPGPPAEPTTPPAAPRTAGSTQSASTRSRPGSATASAAVEVYQGRHEAADCAGTSGWAWDRTQPGRPIYVSIYEDATLLANVLADGFRPDLAGDGVGDGRHGFAYALPERVRDGRPHVIRAQVLAVNIDLWDTARSITCDPTAGPASPTTGVAGGTPGAGRGASPVGTPAFPATDRVAADVPVNLRAGPGTDYRSQGLVPPGTFLLATGETRTVEGGVLWRQFLLADGRLGWIRDVDIRPVRP
jgi:hypothetical protein